MLIDLNTHEQMKLINKFLKRVNPRLVKSRETNRIKQLKLNKKIRERAFLYEDYSWMELFK